MGNEVIEIRKRQGKTMHSDEGQSLISHPWWISSDIDTGSKSQGGKNLATLPYRVAVFRIVIASHSSTWTYPWQYDCHYKPRNESHGTGISNHFSVLPIVCIGTLKIILFQVIICYHIIHVHVQLTVLLIPKCKMRRLFMRLEVLDLND